MHVTGELAVRLGAKVTLPCWIPYHKLAVCRGRREPMVVVVRVPGEQVVRQLPDATNL